MTSIEKKLNKKNKSTRRQFKSRKKNLMMSSKWTRWSPMPKLPPSDKDNSKKNKGNGKISSSNKRKKTKSWNWKGWKKSENNKKLKRKKELKPLKAKKLSSIRLNIDKLTGSEPESSNKEKLKSWFKRWNNWRGKSNKKLKEKK